MEAGLATEMIYESQLDYMDNSATFLFERGDPSEFNYEIPLYYRRVGVRPKLDRFGCGQGVRILNYGGISSISFVVNFFVSGFFIGSKETAYVCRGKIESF